MIKLHLEKHWRKWLLAALMGLGPICLFLGLDPKIAAAAQSVGILVAGVMKSVLHVNDAGEELPQGPTPGASDR